MFARRSWYRIRYSGCSPDWPTIGLLLGEHVKKAGKGSWFDEGARARSGWSNLGHSGPLDVGRPPAQPGPVAENGSFRQSRFGLPTFEPGSLDRGHDGQELGQAWGLRVSRVRTRPAQGACQLLAIDSGRIALGDRRPAWQEDRSRGRADELSPPARPRFSRLLPRRLS